MDLRQLRYFVAVAETRNFNRAAEKLAMAQPPLSRAIQNLEIEMRSTLIDRTVRPLKLTASGRLFYERATQLLAQVDDMRTMMKVAASSERRRFTIGFAASTIYAKLPGLIRGFRKAAPDVELMLVEATTLEQLSALKDGRIDVGFGRIRFDDPMVRRTVLRHERLIVALPAAHPLAQQEGPVSISEVGKLPQILYPRAPRPSYADQVISLLHDHSIEPKIVHEARELQIAIGLVAAEEGVAIVPESVRRSRTEDVLYRDLIESATSPIIMSQRIGDQSPELAVMEKVIAAHYREWGFAVPEALR